MLYCFASSSICLYLCGSSPFILWRQFDDLDKDCDDFDCSFSLLGLFERRNVFDDLDEDRDGFDVDCSVSLVDLFESRNFDDLEEDCDIDCSIRLLGWIESRNLNGIFFFIFPFPFIKIFFLKSPRPPPHLFPDGDRKPSPKSSPSPPPEI